MHVGVCAVVVGKDKAAGVESEVKKKKKSTGGLSVSTELLYNY